MLCVQQGGEDAHRGGAEQAAGYLVRDEWPRFALGAFRIGGDGGLDGDLMIRWYQGWRRSRCDDDWGLLLTE